MTLPERIPAGIGDEQVADAAPLVRALVVERLEKMWRACEPFIEPEAGKPDPRFLEAGIRIQDRLVKLYRLEIPLPPEAPEAEAADYAAEVEAQLLELEGRKPS